MEEVDSVKEQIPQYPSAEILQQACYDDYSRLIETYDKIYEKVNIMLAFCGIILLVILGSVDYTRVLNICKAATTAELFVVLLHLCCTVVSAVCIVWAVIQLLLLLRSKTLLVFNSIDIRNEEIYRWNPDQASLWLIDKYTTVIDTLRGTIKDKQKSYDSAITKVIISLVAYAFVLVIEKGM